MLTVESSLVNYGLEINEGTMKTPVSILFLTLLLGIPACGSAAPLTTPEPAPITLATTTPVTEIGTPESPPPTPTTSLSTDILSPSGLRVVYLREGNLWSWTETGGSQQLTGTGDMSTARLSDDGQLLAFMRGREVWMVRMDGTDARLLNTLEDEGAALWFSPNQALLAVSTKNKIDVIDLTDGSSTTVVTFPAIQEGYFPEVAWSLDSSGFKTVVPPQTPSGQAELLFVFTDGTVASLAKFSMVSLSESLPYFSPDGGYIIYVANLEGETKSLFLMDSSGATRPYGEPGQNIRAHGWLPDSKQFAYGAGNSLSSYLGNIAGPPMGIPVSFTSKVRWVDTEHYLALENTDLVLGDINGEKMPIDSGVQDYDFVP
jgi:hypothetical protein